MSSKNRRTVTAEERALFETVVRNARRRQQATAVHPAEVVPETSTVQRDRKPSPANSKKAPIPPTPELRYHNPPSKAKAQRLWEDGGIDRNTAEKLRKGRLPIDGRLDLHGLRQQPAHRQLFHFIRSAHAAGQRCVLVITGKGEDYRDGGRGVLNVNVPRWLSDPNIKPLILSMRQARPKDGGDGAYYILLRRNRR